MRSALGIVNIVAETEHILMKFINILKCRLHFNTVCFPFKINRLMKRLFFLIQISDKPDDSLRFMIFDMLGLISSFIFEYYRQFRVKICCFMQPAFYFLRPELRLFKNRIIRQKISLSSMSPCNDTWFQYFLLK